MPTTILAILMPLLLQGPWHAPVELPCGKTGTFPGSTVAYCIINNPVPEIGSYFGSAVEALDYNGDGHLDLAVGAAGESGFAKGGRVYIYPGPYFLHFITLIPSMTQPGDRFGWQLESADLDRNGTDDLIVAAPEWDASPSTQDAGYVSVWRHAGGLNQEWLILRRAFETANASLGLALAVGDVVDDSDPEIIAGAPFAPHSTSWFRAGAVSAFTIKGGVSIKETVWVNPQPTSNYNEFGNRLRVADWDADGKDDLVVAAIFNDVGSATPCVPPCVQHAGQIFVLPHQPSIGPNPVIAAVLDNPWPGQEGTTSVCVSERFGMYIDAADVDGDGFAEVVVGANRDDIGGVCEAGRGSFFSGAHWSAATPNAGGYVRRPPMDHDLMAYRVFLADVIGSDRPDYLIGSLSSLRPHALLVWDGDNVITASGVNLDPGNPDVELEYLPDHGGHFCGSLTSADLDRKGKEEMIFGEYDYHGPGGMKFVGRVIITTWR